MAASSAPADDPPSVCLGPGSGWSIGSGDRPTFGLLTRELARQAFLIAAREECGACTHDAWLGDEVAKSGDNAPFDLVCSAGQPSLMEILRGFGSAEKSIWHEELAIGDEFDYPAYVTRMESMSRTEFVRVLEQEGFKRQEPRASASRGELPADVAKWLDEMRFTSQFAAVRQLHALRGSDRDNPARLGGLVRGYANLGMMSEYFFNPMHRVFKARALLYAERLVVVEHQSPRALAYRAYARALVGLHGAALQDLAAAKADPKAKAADLPKWTSLLEGLCRFDTSAVKTVADPALDQLAALLRLVMAEQSDILRLIPRVARAEALKVPECYRICDGYLVHRYYNHPDSNEEQPANGSATMAQTLYGRLQELPGLPPAVATAAESYESDELARRQAVMRALLATETSKPSAASDEFSWRLLGRILVEISFYQAWREIHPDSYGSRDDQMLTFPPSELINKLRPLYADHRYAGFLEMAQADSKERQKGYRKILETFDADAVEFQQWPFYDYLLHFTDGHLQSDGFWFVILNRLDGVARDLAQRIQMEANPNGVGFARSLLAVSPYHPLARATLLEYAWDQVRSQAADWERTSLTQPRVLAALSKRYAQSDPAAAERLLQAIADASPTAANVAALAMRYDRAGKAAEWLKAMTKLATLPDVKDRGEIHGILLQYYMDHGDVEHAAAEAVAAVETNTSAGLLAGAGYYESLQEWDEAEADYRKASENDPAVVFDWYYFCRRTGQGDALAAAKLGAKWVAQREQMKEEQPQAFQYALLPTAAFYLMSDRPKTARRYFVEEFNRSSDPFCGLHAALISDQLKDAQVRDQSLADIPARHANWVRLNPNRPSKEIVALAAMFAADLSKKGNGDLDFDAIKKLLSTATQIERINCYYFVGQYLHLHGNSEKAREVWLQSVPLFPIRAFNRTLSGCALADNGTTPIFYQDAMKQWTTKSKSEPKRNK